MGLHSYDYISKMCENLDVWKEGFEFQKDDTLGWGEDEKSVGFFSTGNEPNKYRSQQITNVATDRIKSLNKPPVRILYTVRHQFYEKVEKVIHHVSVKLTDLESFDDNETIKLFDDLIEFLKISCVFQKGVRNINSIKESLPTKFQEVQSEAIDSLIVILDRCLSKQTGEKEKLSANLKQLTGKLYNSTSAPTIFSHLAKQDANSSLGVRYLLSEMKPESIGSKEYRDILLIAMEHQTDLDFVKELFINGAETALKIDEDYNLVHLIAMRPQLSKVFKDLLDSDLITSEMLSIPYQIKGKETHATALEIAMEYQKEDGELIEKLLNKVTPQQLNDPASNWRHAAVTFQPADHLLKMVDHFSEKTLKFPNANGSTPLHLLPLNPQGGEFLKILLNLNRVTSEMIGKEDNNGRTLLNNAMWYLKDGELLETLLNKAPSELKNDRSWLQLAISKQSGENLLKMIDYFTPENFSIPDGDGNTLIHSLATNPQGGEFFKTLLASNLVTTEMISLPNKSGYTPFEMAMEVQKDGELLEALIKKAPPELINSPNSKWYLFAFAKQPDANLLKLIDYFPPHSFNFKNREGNSLMHLALKEKGDEVLTALVNKGGAKALEILDLQGNTVLHLLMEQKAKGNVISTILEIAKDNRSLFNFKNSKGDTLAHLAARFQSAENILKIFDLSPPEVFGFNNTNSSIPYNELVKNESVNHPEFFVTLSNGIGKDLLSKQNRNGDSTLHLIAENPMMAEVFKTLLELDFATPDMLKISNRKNVSVYGSVMRHQKDSAIFDLLLMKSNLQSIEFQLKSKIKDMLVPSRSETFNFEEAEQKIIAFQKRHFGACPFNKELSEILQKDDFMTKYSNLSELVDMMLISYPNKKEIDRLVWLNEKIIPALFQLGKPSLRIPLFQHAVSLIKDEKAIDNFNKLSKEQTNLIQNKLWQNLTCLMTATLITNESDKRDVDAFRLTIEKKGTIFAKKENTQELIEMLLLLVQNKKIERKDKIEILKRVSSERNEDKKQTQLLNNVYSVISLIDFSEEAKLIDSSISLKNASESAFKERCPFDDVDDFATKYAQIIVKSRNPTAFTTYAGKIHSLNEPDTTRCFGKFVSSVLNGTFHEQRYDVDDNYHLQTLEDYNPGILEKWKTSVCKSEKIEELNLEQKTEKEVIFSAKEWMQNKLIRDNHLPFFKDLHFLSKYLSEPDLQNSNAISKELNKTYILKLASEIQDNPASPQIKVKINNMRSEILKSDDPSLENLKNALKAIDTIISEKRKKIAELKKNNEGTQAVRSLEKEIKDAEETILEILKMKEELGPELKKSLNQEDEKLLKLQKLCLQWIRSSDELNDMLLSGKDSLDKKFQGKESEIKYFLLEIQYLLNSAKVSQFLHDVTDRLTAVEKMKKEELQENKYKDFVVVDSDDPIDLLLCGTEVLDSCQRVDGTPEINKGLLGYLLNGQNRLVEIKNSAGEIEARRLLRLILNPDKEPVLYMEPIYPNNVPIMLSEALTLIAKRKAKDLGVPLVSEDGEGGAYPMSLESLGGPAAWEYCDGSSDAHLHQYGEYTITNARYV